MKLSCVILTMGGGPAGLRRALRSALAQQDVDLEAVVVANGAPVPDVPSGVTVLGCQPDLGVAGGRNAGVQAASGDVVVFLDDDGWFPDWALGQHIAGRFAADPELAVIAFRVLDPAACPQLRWRFPRRPARDPGRRSAVTTFAGGACAVRRTAYLAAGGLPEGFCAHAETDLAWRLLGLGYRLEYDACALTCHHAVPSPPDAAFHRLDGRHRVLLARRNLPWPLAALYLLDWCAVTLARERSLSAARAWLAGAAEGWRVEPGERRPVSLRTVWRMTRAGRPPVI